jgi:hypothetical protein
MKMKNLKWLLILAVSVTSLGCSVLPIKAEVKENHFRFENFKRDKGPKREFIHLMCFHKKPILWAEPKQYLSGEHNLWVKARISERGIPNSRKEAFVNFKVNLAAGTSYMLNRKIEGNKITLWIQEVDTGLGVSEIIVADLKQPKITEYNLRKTQCESSSV